MLKVNSWPTKKLNNCWEGFENMGVFDNGRTVEPLQYRFFDNGRMVEMLQCNVSIEYNVF